MSPAASDGSDGVGKPPMRGEGVLGCTYICVRCTITSKNREAWQKRVSGINFLTLYIGCTLMWTKHRGLTRFFTPLGKTDNNSKFKNRMRCSIYTYDGTCVCACVCVCGKLAHPRLAAVAKGMERVLIIKWQMSWGAISKGIEEDL